ncbi:MAG: EI24 domain-containing protein [Myxococcaceae bacterium]|nr:EI24 domain-containing protein [Myxococcaceae bacterium]
MTPSFRAEGRLSDFFAGLALPVRAVRVIANSKQLVLLSFVSSLVTFASLVALVWVLGSLTDDFVRRFLFEPTGWLSTLAFWILVVLTFLLALVVGANILPVLLLAPLQDPISEATEEACGDYRAPPFSVNRLLTGTFVALGHTLLRVTFLMGGHALLFALNLIPVAGNALWTVTSILWTMIWLATEYLDAPMARHLYRFGDVQRAVMRRLPLCLGFGAAVYVILWVPILNFFFIPLAIVAGTLLFRGLRACGSVGAPEGLPGGLAAS